MLGGDGRKKNGGARAGAGRKAGLPNSSTLEFRNYVRQYTKEAVDMFVAAMRDEKMDMRFRLEAAIWLVERGYGKPAMQVAAQSENDGSEQKEFRTVEEIRLFLLERGIDVARLPSPCAVIEGKTLMLELEPDSASSDHIVPAFNAETSPCLMAGSTRSRLTVGKTMVGELRLRPAFP
jgi:hypothetical protein